jgi:pimeloyl-ACP methyl ester carboxylesterase
MKEDIFDNRIYYRTNDWREDRLTLVFVHGVAGSSSAYEPYEKMFSDNYNILTYDLRGHGNSKKYPSYEDYEIKNYVQDLEDLINNLNIKNLILVSHSFGGIVALEYTKTYKEKILVDIFISPEIYLEKNILVSIMPTFFKIVCKILSIIPFNPKTRGHVDYAKYVGSTDWDIKRNLADITHTGLHSHFYSLRHSMDYENKYELREIEVPTLIIHGEKDSMVDIKNARLMSKEIRDCRLIEIKDIDHNTVHNGVGEVSKAILDFIHEKF